MESADLTPEAEAVTDAIFETFRLHGDLIAFGDRMVARFGLTSARWQVLGTVVRAPAEMTVARIARHLGLSRQAVQRVANDLEGAGLIRFDPNPEHKRARLVRLTEAGEHAYRRAESAYATWANAACAGFTAAEIRGTIDVLRRLDGLCTAYPDGDTAARDPETER